MKTKIGRAYGKIILSGNTANRFGKRALAAPVDMGITAVWQEGDSRSVGLEIIWNGHEERDVWITTVRKIISMIETAVGNISGRLTISNTLPLGRGLGSSTAIVVALARCFFGVNCKGKALAIENVVNKGHSGLDFAVIWEERPIIIQGDKYEFTELPVGLQRGVLFDTGLPAAPTPVIIHGLKSRLSMETGLMRTVEAIGACTERLLSGENPLSVFPDHYNSLVTLGVIPPKVRSMIEKIQRAGGAAKPGRFGGATGGVGMVFAVHPKIDALRKITGNTSFTLIYDPSCLRFLVARQKPIREQLERIRATRQQHVGATVQWNHEISS